MSSHYTFLNRSFFSTVVYWSPFTHSPLAPTVSSSSAVRAHYSIFGQQDVTCDCMIRISSCCLPWGAAWFSTTWALLFASDSKLLLWGSVAEAVVETSSHSNKASWEVTLLTASDFSRPGAGWLRGESWLSVSLSWLEVSLDDFRGKKKKTQKVKFNYYNIFNWVKYVLQFSLVAGNPDEAPSRCQPRLVALHNACCVMQSIRSAASSAV